MNLKKYNKNDAQPASKPFNTTLSTNKPVKSDIIHNTVKNSTNSVRNNFHVNGTTKRPISAPIANIKQFIPKDLTKPKTAVNILKTDTKTNVKSLKKVDVKPIVPDKVIVNTVKTEKTAYVKNYVNANKIIPPKIDVKARKSMAPSQPPKVFSKPTENLRKSMLPTKVQQSISKVNPKRQSVFERLYQPKTAPKKQFDEVQQLQTDPNYLKKVLKNSGLILNKRHTVFEPKRTLNPTVRRSISAVHFKRISKNEMSNCITKWSSIGENIDKVHLEVNEDENIKEDKVVSAIKSERKKVKFQTPIPFNFNTPKPDELQSRLQNWLKKRGKSLDSYHHLQCFGIHHLPQRQVLKPLDFNENVDDEDKENVPLPSDSDDESYTDNMNDRKNDFPNVMDNPKVMDDEWRRASFISDSVDLNDTQESIMTPEVVDDLLIGVLNDLTDLLREVSFM